MKRISPSPRMGVGARTRCPQPLFPASTLPRICVLGLLLVCMPAIGQAYCYSSYGCGVRYSPYAFSYHSSGLVPCDVEYTPYAFSYSSSGLVQCYGVCYSGSYCGYGYPVFQGRLGSTRHIIHRPAPRVIHHPARHITHRPAQPVRRCAQDATQPDGMSIIRQHLQAKGFAYVNIDRILRVDNQLVSVDFLVKERNLLIKYWNPKGLEQISTKEAYKQKVCAKYKEDWEQYARRYKQKGGKIYVVNASEPQTIVAALDSCTRLSPELGAPSQQTMYAKE